MFLTKYYLIGLKRPGGDLHLIIIIIIIKPFGGFGEGDGFYPGPKNIYFSPGCRGGIYEGGQTNSHLPWKFPISTPHRA